MYILGNEQETLILKENVERNFVTLKGFEYHLNYRTDKSPKEPYDRTDSLFYIGYSTKSLSLNTQGEDYLQYTLHIEKNGNLAFGLPNWKYNEVHDTLQFGMTFASELHAYQFLRKLLNLTWIKPEPNATGGQN